MLKITTMSLELMVDLHRAGFPVPFGILSLVSIVYVDFHGTALIAETTFNSVVKP